MSRLTLPSVVKRRAQSYVGIARNVSIPFGKAISQTMPRVGGWLGAAGIEHGPALMRYNLIDMPALEMEFGFVLPRKHAGEGEITAGTLPAGRYATLTFWGHYRHLIEATGLLIVWARDKKLDFDMTAGKAGDRFASRFELYPNGPAEEPDPDKWETQLFIKLRD